MINVTILPSVHVGPDQHKMYFDACAKQKVADM
jgi:hypothetical protein